jgi:hypothetical protein
MAEAPAPLLNGHGRLECSCGAVIAACACGPLRETVKPLVAVRACPGCRKGED